MEPRLMSIGEAAKMLGLSIKTLQRWDKSGKLLSVRRPGGHRYYNLKNIENYLANLEVAGQDLFTGANFWAFKSDPSEPDPLFYCQTSPIFLAKLTKVQNKLAEIPELENIFPLIIAIAGEIGDNSFAHNIGNWPDIPGIFFGYDVNKKEIVLADRGRGILETLKRVRPSLKSSADALRVAFTEIVSGRAPEERGNGLKFVRKIITNNNINLYFKTGDAEIEIGKGDDDLKIVKSSIYVRGCIALINF
jgi:excisionase family DNA binding protein